MDLFKRRNISHEIRRFGQFGRNKMRQCGIPLNKSDFQILRLKNRHAGKRAFIIGNGPSLKVADLQRLKQEITFASNKIYLSFEQTDWRPTYYCVMDRLVAQNNREVIQRLEFPKYISDDLRPWINDGPDVVWLRELWNNGVVDPENSEYSPTAEGCFSTNAFYGVEAGYTVTFSQLQLAYYMGITEVYLIGIDFSFIVPNAKVQSEVYGAALMSAGEQNHFHPDYRKPGEVWAIPKMECQQRLYCLARNIFDNNGRKVYNASRQSKLEVFERVSLDEVLMRSNL